MAVDTIISMEKIASNYQENVAADALQPVQKDELATLFNAGQYANMESRANSLVSQYPKSGFAWKALGAALQAQGKDALDALRNATILLPDDAEAFNNLGNALRDNERLDDAATSYRKSLKINPNFAQAYSNLGTTLLESGDLAEAEECLRKALQIQSNFLYALYNLANVLREKGAFDEAIATYCHALTINPQFAEAQGNLGRALQDSGQLEAAAHAYENAISIKPDLLDAHYGLSSLKTYRDGDSDLAALESQIDRIEKLSIPKQIRYWYTLGKAREDVGRYNESFAA